MQKPFCHMIGLGPFAPRPRMTLRPDMPARRHRRFPVLEVVHRNPSRISWTSSVCRAPGRNCSLRTGAGVSQRHCTVRLLRSAHATVLFLVKLDFMDSYSAGELSAV